MRVRLRHIAACLAAAALLYTAGVLQGHQALQAMHARHSASSRPPTRPAAATTSTTPPPHASSRLQAVRESIRHAWAGYRRCAFGKDELSPLSCTGNDRWGALQWTLVDAADTLHIAGLDEEFRDAARQLAASSFAQNSIVSTFETTIRILGGSLSAYELTGDPLFLAKAVDIGGRLHPAFATPHGMPTASVHMLFGNPYLITGEFLKKSNVASLASIGSLQMEFSRLSRITQDPRYNDSARGALRAVFDAQRGFVEAKVRHEGRSGFAVTHPLHLFPTSYDLSRGAVRRDEEYYTTGSGADSFYEYLLKTFILEGGRDTELLHAYTSAADEILRYLVRDVTLPENRAFSRLFEDGGADAKHTTSAIRHNGPSGAAGGAGLPPPGSAPTPIRAKAAISLLDGFPHWQMEHLSCFLPGLLALGADYGRRHGVPPLVQRAEEHMRAAEGLLKTCVYFYAASPTGLSADAYNVAPDGGAPYPVRGKQGYALRPETVESLFVMHRVTGAAWCLSAARFIHAAIERSCKVPDGYAALNDATLSGLSRGGAVEKHRDRMESFHLAETLKYLYLIEAGPGAISLDDYVFNTEAHPLLQEVGGGGGGV